MRGEARSVVSAWQTSVPPSFRVRHPCTREIEGLRRGRVRQFCQQKTPRGLKDSRKRVLLVSRGLVEKKRFELSTPTLRT